MTTSRFASSLSTLAASALIFIFYLQTTTHTQAQNRQTKPTGGQGKPALTKKSAEAEIIRLHNQAFELSNRGQYDAALPLLKSALVIAENTFGSEDVNVAYSLNNLAQLYYHAKGDYAQAEPLYLRALAIDEKVLGVKHPIVAIVLVNLARIYQEKGDFPNAERRFLRSLAIREEVLGANHPDVAYSLSSLAVLYRAQGDLAFAEKLLLRAQKIYEKALLVEHRDFALSLNILAGLYRAQGDYARAEPLYLRALAIREKVFGANHLDVAESLNNLALLVQAKGDYAHAESLLLRALTIDEKLVGVKHPIIAIALSNLARLYQAQGNSAHAVRLLTRSTDIREGNLSLILQTGSEHQKRLYIETLAPDTNYTISLHLHSASDLPAASRLALTTILRRKGRALDAMTDQIGALRRRLNPQDRALLDELSSVTSQLAALTLKGVGHTDPAQHREEIVRLEAEKERLEAQVSARSAEFRVQSQPVTLERVQQAIPVEAALVEMVLYSPFNAKGKTNVEKWGPPRYAAYVLRREGNPSAIDLGEAAVIDRAITDLRDALKDRSRADVKQLARQLDESVMRPVRNLLGKTRQLLLSPDGDLNLIPFGALVDVQNRYLAESYSITYVTSGRDLLRMQTHATSRQESMVFANPLFDWTSGSRSRRAGAEIARRRSLDFKTALITPLPGTAGEAEALRSILPGARILTGAAATESAVKSVNAPQILHIATHGFFLPDQKEESAPDEKGDRRIKHSDGTSPGAPPGENPLLRSGLVFAGAKQQEGGGGEDGILTSLEAAGLDLWGTKLVVLSACDTGLGSVSSGNGVYGLRRALVLAGAESQVMSLWQVSDTATKDLMTAYYTRLQRGEGRSESLRQVQLEMLRQPKRAHPFYWASFIPIGDWRNLAGK